MKGVIYLESVTFHKKKFNEKKAGALVGTITETMEYLRELYATIGKSRDNSRAWTSEDFSAHLEPAAHVTGPERWSILFPVA